MNDDTVTTTATTTMPSTPLNAAAYSTSTLDAIRVASVDPIMKPSRTILVATISTTLHSDCGKSLWYSCRNNTRHSHHNKQRMVRGSILFISMMIVATVCHLYKSTVTFNQYDLPDGNQSINSYDTPATTTEASANRVKANAASVPLQTVTQDELIHLTIEDYVIQKLPFLLNSNNRNSNKKQMEVLQKNLQFAYRNVSEMLDRSQRFPSIQQRVKLYMSNWYIPPCQNDDRIVYEYSTTGSSSGIVPTSTSTTNSNTEPKKAITALTVHEMSKPLVVDNNSNSRNKKAKQKFPNPQQPQQRVFVINSHFDGTHDESFDEVHYMDRQWFEQNCTHKYCQDMVEFLLPALDRVQQEPNNNIHNDFRTIPILYQFGDMHQTRATQFHPTNHTYTKRVRYPNLPVIQKVRMSQSQSNLFDITDDTKFQCYQSHERRVSIAARSLITLTDNPTRNQNNNKIPLSSPHFEPIIFKLKTHRHYGGIYKVADADTMPWDSKKNSAIFRGSLTGLFPNNMNAKDVEKLTEYDRCRLLPRCWFTVMHATSTLVDSKLTEPYAESKGISRVIKIPSNQQKLDLYGNRMSMDELLQYKALILLEGNDVSSGLKWALFSNSIVMMPPPTLTSWAMEEMLQPWVHYVPIQVYTTNTTKEHHGDDAGTKTNGVVTTFTFTDAEEKMQWIIDNDDKAREIVKASTLFIADLVLHPDVPKDEASIFDEMARRYLSHFV